MNNMKGLAGLFVIVVTVVIVGWCSFEGVDSQSTRVSCKYKFSRDDYYYCTEHKKGRKNRARCLISAGCSQHKPIYEFTTLATNHTKECQQISACMLRGGAKICDPWGPCDEKMDPAKCDDLPERYEPTDCLRLKNRRLRPSRDGDAEDSWLI